MEWEGKTSDFFFVAKEFIWLEGFSISNDILYGWIIHLDINVNFIFFSAHCWLCLKKFVLVEGYGCCWADC